jgi:glutathione S-transferase
MIDFYFMPGSTPCMKVRLFLEVCGTPFRPILLNLWKGEHRAEAFRTINPMMKIPAIDVGGFTLGESNAILRYLAAKAERYDCYPLNLETRAVVDQWLDYLSAHVCESVGALVWQQYWVPKNKMSSDSDKIERETKNLVKTLAVVDSHLEGRRYFAGACPSLADFGLMPYVAQFQRAGIDLGAYPNLQMWWKNIEVHAAWQRCHREILG